MSNFLNLRRKCPRCYGQLYQMHYGKSEGRIATNFKYCERCDTIYRYTPTKEETTNLDDLTFRN